MEEVEKNIIGIIPARMGSSRFPGKPLAPILGIPMLGHVYKRSKMSRLLKEVYIATYDFEKEIIEYAHSIGAKVMLADKKYDRASDITAHVMREVEKETGEKVDIVVMIQGDEPMVVPEMIDMAAKPLIEDAGIYVANLMALVATKEEREDPNCPKVVVDLNNFALYFSREPIPSQKKWKGDVPETWKQVCIIPFTRDFLLKFNELEPTSLEVIESIDMNRILQHGYKVKMIPESLVTQAVDTLEDLKKVEELMSNDPLIKSYAQD